MPGFTSRFNTAGKLLTALAVLTVAGLLTAGSLSVTGDATIGGDLTVSGTNTNELAVVVTATNTAALDIQDGNGTSIFNVNTSTDLATVTGDLTITGTCTGCLGATTMNDLSDTSLAGPGLDSLLFWDESDSQFEFLTLLEGLSITGGTLSVASASTSATGTVELATTAETTTGTDTGRAVTPDGLAGSIYGQKSIGIVIADGSTAVTAASNTNAIVIPPTMDGMNVTDVVASVTDKGVTGSTDVTIWKKDPVEGLVEVLSTDVTIGDEFFASDGTVNTTYDDLSEGDQLYIEVTGVHSGTAPNGLSVMITAQTP